MNITTEMEQFLKGTNVAVLATVGPGGQPHAAPIWYVYENGALTFFTGRGSQKCKNIQRDNRVTLVVDKRELPYYVATLQGEAREVDPPADLRLRMAKHYLGEDAGASYVARNPGGDSVAFRITPGKVNEYRGEAGRE